MTVIILFTLFLSLSIALYVHRNKLIDGVKASSRMDDVSAFAHWESMIIKSETAKEKMVYMRLADEVKSKIITEAAEEAAKHMVLKPVHRKVKVRKNGEQNKDLPSTSGNVVTLSNWKVTSSKKAGG